jgi:prolyl oligopeptidase
LRALFAIGTLSPPVPRRGLYFYEKRSGSQEQPVLYVREGCAGPDRALLDPTTQAADAACALDWHYPSADGRLLAYGLSHGGSEKSTLRVLEVATGRDLGEAIPFTRACSLEWQPDGSAFYYTRYPEPGSVPAGQEDYNRRVFFHRLGTDWQKDTLVFAPNRKTGRASHFRRAVAGSERLPRMDAGGCPSPRPRRPVRDSRGERGSRLGRGSTRLSLLTNLSLPIPFHQVPRKPRP